MQLEQAKHRLKVAGAKLWDEQVALVNRIQAEINAEPVVILTKRDKVVFWVRATLGAALALFLFYTAFTHGGPTP